MRGTFVLDSIEIEGFRGYLKPIKHYFGGKSALIFGPQGSGKSSTLNAIEWGLFGKIAYFKSAEGKSDIELINSRAIGLECKVTVILRNKTSTIEITRKKRASSKESDLSVKTDGGTKVGTDADEFLFSELGLTLDDFYRSVYLHQESIRAIITDDPRNRDEAIDRLLGLEKARDIIGNIPMSKVKKDLDELTNQKEKITAKLQGAIQQISSEVEKAESEAQKEGLQDDQLTSSQISAMMSDLTQKTAKLATDCRIEPPELSAELSTDSVSKTITKVKTFIRQCRKRAIEITGVDELRNKQSELKQMKVDLKRITTEVEIRREETGSIKQNFGDLNKLEMSLDTAKTKLVELKKKQEALDANAKLAKEALFFFEDPSLTVCPVCGQPVERGEIKKHLEEVVESVKGSKVNEIYENMKAVNDDIKILSGKKEELQTLEARLNELTEESNALKGKIRQITLADLGTEDMERNIEDTLASIQTKIEESGRAYQKRNEQIEDTDQCADKIRVINNILLKREEYQAMDKRSKEDLEESKGISQSIREVETFKDRLDTLVSVLNEVQTSLASQSISETQEEIGKLYSRLHAHPYYNKLNISVTSKSVAGVQKNTYLIKASSTEESRDTYVSSRFSTGQINCAALAIFLSLAKMSKSGIGFIMLDDPSQSLDLEHSGGLSEILAEVSDERQIILATQDENLFSELNKKFFSHDNFVDVKFKPWTKNGCTIEN